jgi:lysine N6-hydroxylase
MNQDYSVKWNNPKNKIFIQNGLKYKFGLADANLSLATWRNAVIINSLLERQVYKVNSERPIFKINF